METTKRLKSFAVLEPSPNSSSRESNKRDTMATGFRSPEDGQIGIPDSNRVIEIEDSF